jgi:hypothetical protein
MSDKSKEIYEETTTPAIPDDGQEIEETSVLTTAITTPVSATDFTDEEESPLHEEETSDEESPSNLPSLSTIEYGTSENVTLVSNPLRYDEEYRKIVDEEVRLELPSIRTMREVNARRREIDEVYKEVNPDDVAQENLEGVSSTERTISMYHRDDIFDALLNDMENDIQQGVIGQDGKRYGMSSPSVKIPVKGYELTGAAALSHMTRVIGTGGALNNTLWSCGISVGIRPLSGLEYNALDNTMTLVKREKGWATSGLTYSAGNSVTLVAFLKELKNYITSCNFHTSDPTALYDIIDVTDVQALVGMAGGTMFPNGVRFERPCSNTMACGHVASGKLLYDRVRIDFNNKLTPEQRQRGAFSSSGKRKFTQEEVNVYKESHSYRGKDDVLRLTAENGAEVVYHLKVPSINQFIEDTDMWTNRIIDSTVASLNEEVEDDERARFLRKASLRSQCAQYLSWIDHIELGDAVIRKREDIVANLEIIQPDNELVKGFVAGIRKFIRSATISIIAIPAYTCIKCKTKNVEAKEEEIHPSLIALDALDLFFRLGTLQTMRSVSNIARI